MLPNGCVQSLDWTDALDYWTQVFSLIWELVVAITQSITVSLSTERMTQVINGPLEVLTQLHQTGELLYGY